MSIKRIANIHNPNACNCLKCGCKLENLKDNEVNTCGYCGQRHLVDIYKNNTIVLTVAERPELRKSPDETKEVSPEYAQNQEAFNKRLEKFRKKWKGVNADVY